MKASSTIATAGSSGAESGNLTHQQDLVRQALQSLLDSQHFSKSKRYPALLEYVVLNTLEGNAGALKERVVGAEVFGRPPSYDPGSDPVVRIAAGEVRRRLAEYYSEHPQAPVRIELPRGGYTAEFHFRTESEVPAESVQSRLHSVSDSALTHDASATEAIPQENSRSNLIVASPAWWKTRPAIFAAVTIFALCAVFAGVRWRAQQIRAKQDLWWPVLHSSQPAIIVVGRHGQNAANFAAPAATTPDPAGRSNLLMDDVIVTAQTCNIFRTYGHDCAIRVAQTMTLDDFRGKSTVVLGAFNNQWTPKFIQSLPLQVQNGSAATGTPDKRMILERTPAGDQVRWMIGPDVIHGQSGTDYALIARFQSDLTNNPAIWIAGLGPEGTSGAGQFIFSSDGISQIMARAPKDWKGLAFEAVLQVDYNQGQPTSVKLLDARYW